MKFINAKKLHRKSGVWGTRRSVVVGGPKLGLAADEFLFALAEE